jgi:hypothetical protein
VEPWNSLRSRPGLLTDRSHADQLLLDPLGDRDPQVGHGDAGVGEAQLGSSTRLPTMVVWLSAAMVLLRARESPTVVNLAPGHSPASAATDLAWRRR